MGITQSLRHHLFITSFYALFYVTTRPLRAGGQYE